MSSDALLLPEIWRPVLSLLLASVIVMGSPGPSTISATAVGAAYGFRRSLVYVSGLILGTTAVLAAVAAGVVAILLSIPRGAAVLTGASAVYILYLAYRIATAPPLQTQSGEAAAPAFGGGFLLGVANPKAYLSIAAVFAGTTVFAESYAVDALVKTALLGVMVVAIHVFWLSAGASLSRVLRHPTSSRIVNLLLAASLVAVTVAAFMG